VYKCVHFKIEELVHPSFIGSIAEDILWELFDERLLQAADRIREHHGAIVVNSKSMGLVDSGLRVMNDSRYPKYDPHKLARALDLHIMSIENQNLPHDKKVEAYNEVRKLWFCIAGAHYEDNISWLHIDTYNRTGDTF
jgi:hypothetical protein